MKPARREGDLEIPGGEYLVVKFERVEQQRLTAATDRGQALPAAHAEPADAGQAALAEGQAQKFVGLVVVPGSEVVGALVVERVDPGRIDELSEFEQSAAISGSKGFQLYLPFNSDAGYDRSKPFAREVAAEFERQLPDRVVSRMTRSRRPGKVLIDWSQNSEHETTVCAYSMRATARPSVSTPVTWEEVERAADDPGGAIHCISGRRRC